MALRSLTDEVMFEIVQLCGDYEYHDTYATKRAEDLPTPPARVAVAAPARVAQRAHSRARSSPRRHRTAPAATSAASALGSNSASARQARAAPARAVPHVHREPGEERRAEGGRLLDGGALHRDAEQVGLELAQQVHHAGAAVDAQAGEVTARRGADGLDDVADLPRDRLHDGPGQMRAGRAARDAEHRAARVRVPPRRARAR